MGLGEEIPSCPLIKEEDQNIESHGSVAGATLTCSRQSTSCCLGLKRPPRSRLVFSAQGPLPGRLRSSSSTLEVRKSNGTISSLLISNVSSRRSLHSSRALLSRWANLNSRRRRRSGILDRYIQAMASGEIGSLPLITSTTK